jgi:hypothetical protein
MHRLSLYGHVMCCHSTIIQLSFSYHSALFSYHSAIMIQLSFSFCYARAEDKFQHSFLHVVSVPHYSSALQVGSPQLTYIARDFDTSCNGSQLRGTVLPEWMRSASGRFKEIVSHPNSRSRT